MTLKTGHIVQNRYRIVRLVGQGGFGAVYRAWDLNVSQPVALKMNLGADAEAQRQFVREATLLASLRHPGLPRVTDHFVISGQGQYLVMDFVEGKSLADLLRERGGPLDEAEALPWILQVCEALTYLHTRRPPVIHRDIKPDNIIINPDGRAILVDFGISKVFDAEHQTTIGAKAVTPGFSPPEQYGMHSTDGRSDVYALAATLYRLLTAQMPPESVAIMAAGVRLTPVHEVNPAISPTTSRAIERGMAPIMAQRTASAAEFAADLKALPLASAAPIVESAVAVSRTPAPASAPSDTPAAPVAQHSARPVRSDGGGATLALMLVGVALSMGLFWLGRRVQDTGIDYRAAVVVYGLAYLGVLLIGAWGGPWLGALGGALVGVGLRFLIFYWELPFALAPVSLGFVIGLLSGRGRMRTFVGAALVGLIGGLVVTAVDLLVRWFLWRESGVDVPIQIIFVASVGLAGMVAWLLARLMPRRWLARFPLGRKVR